VLELALQLSAIFTTLSKPEVSLHHTPYFHTETLAIILELFSILYHCYYSQNYSGIIITGLSASGLFDRLGVVWFPDPVSFHFISCFTNTPE